MEPYLDFTLAVGVAQMSYDVPRRRRRNFSLPLGSGSNPEDRQEQIKAVLTSYSGWF